MRRSNDRPHVPVEDTPCSSRLPRGSNVPILLYGTTGVPKLSFRGVRARYFLQEVVQDAPLVSLGS